MDMPCAAEDKNRDDVVDFEEFCLSFACQPKHVGAFGPVVMMNSIRRSQVLVRVLWRQRQ